MGKAKRNRNKQAVETAASAKSKSPAKSGARKAPIVPVTIAIAAIVVVVTLIAGRGATTVTFVDGKVSRTIAAVDECAFTTLQLSIPADVVPEDAAAAVFDALSRTAGVGLVTVYEDDPRVEIDYCQSYTSEPALREALAQTGYLAP